MCWNVCNVYKDFSKFLQWTFHFFFPMPTWSWQHRVIALPSHWNPAAPVGFNGISASQWCKATLIPAAQKQCCAYVTVLLTFTLNGLVLSSESRAVVSMNNLSLGPLLWRNILYYWMDCQETEYRPKIGVSHTCESQELLKHIPSYRG